MAEAMTTEIRYDEIRRKFAEREAAQRRFMDEDNRFAIMIANGFRDYLGMPELWERERDGCISQQSYVPLYRIEDDGEFKEQTFWKDAITHYSDGNFDFVLGIILEHGENTFPKQCVQVKVECKRGNGEVSVKIANQIVECTFDGTDSPDIVKVHELLHQLLNEYLDSRWGNDRDKPKIGFQMIQ